MNNKPVVCLLCGGQSPEHEFPCCRPGGHQAIDRNAMMFMWSGSPTGRLALLWRPDDFLLTAIIRKSRPCEDGRVCSLLQLY